MNIKIKKLSILFLTFILLLTFCACGSKASLAEYEITDAADYAYENGMSYLSSSDSVSESVSSTDSTDLTYVFSGLEGKNLKIIYTANVTIQTEDFDSTLKEIVSTVDELEGYFESSDVYNGSYYNSSLRSGNYTIRIPSESYSKFINQLGDNWHVVNLSQDSQDISEQYADVEGHLETLKIKQERLQTLLKQATNMSDIITIEDSLSDVEYEIEKYSGQLNKYDSLVGYSTIYLSLDEVSQYSDPVSEEGFFTRLGRAFVNGIKHFVSNLGEIVLWFARNIVALIIIAAIIFVVCKFHLLKKIFKKRNKKEEK